MKEKRNLANFGILSWLTNDEPKSNLRRTAIMSIILSSRCLVIATALLAFFAVACGTSKPGPNPLEGGGWSLLPSQDPKKLDKEIRDDYQDYIQHLAPKERKFIGFTNVYEDGSGRHAVKISMPHGGTWWEHVLIYDQNNRRVQALKRDAGHYGDNYW